MAVVRGRHRGRYQLINVIFAALYYFGAPCIAELPAGSFGGAFFFSVETLATDGYGNMYHDTLYGPVVATGEGMALLSTPFERQSSLPVAGS